MVAWCILLGMACVHWVSAVPCPAMQPSVSPFCIPLSPLEADLKPLVCAAETPQWRDGPHGLKTACNACGIKWTRGNLPGYNVRQQPLLTPRCP